MRVTDHRHNFACPCCSIRGKLHGEKAKNNRGRTTPSRAKLGGHATRPFGPLVSFRVSRRKGQTPTDSAQIAHVELDRGDTFMVSQSVDVCNFCFLGSFIVTIYSFTHPAKQTFETDA